MTQWDTVSRWRGQPCSSFWRGAPWSSESTRENCRIYLYCCVLRWPPPPGTPRSWSGPAGAAWGRGCASRGQSGSRTWRHNIMLVTHLLYLPRQLVHTPLNIHGRHLELSPLEKYRWFHSPAQYGITFTFLSLAARDICAMRAAISSQYSKSTQ